MAIYNDLKRSRQTMRISLSHLTTVLEINRFLETFEVEYRALYNLIGRWLNGKVNILKIWRAIYKER